MGAMIVRSRQEIKPKGTQTGLKFEIRTTEVATRIAAMKMIADTISFVCLQTP